VGKKGRRGKGKRTPRAFFTDEPGRLGHGEEPGRHLLSLDARRPEEGGEKKETKKGGVFSHLLGDSFLSDRRGKGKKRSRIPVQCERFMYRDGGRREKKEKKERRGLGHRPVVPCSGKGGGSASFWKRRMQRKEKGRKGKERKKREL